MPVEYENMLVEYDGKVVEAVSQEFAPVAAHFFGVLETSTRPDPMAFDVGELTRVNTSSNQPEWTIVFPEVVGFLVFMEHVICPERKEWRVEGLNSGRIGGPWQSLDANFFPYPNIRAYQGSFWRVYVTSYASLVSKPLIFSV